MALVLICECGSKLEIDPGFKGRMISCPDCNRPLRIQRTPPRLFTVALLSLGTSILGFLTIVGSLAGMAMGYWAAKTIERDPHRWSGHAYAKAGLYTGIAGLITTLLLHYVGESIGIDGFLREIRWAGQLDYPNDFNVEKTISNEFKARLVRPSHAWGVVKVSDSGSATPELGLFNTWLDGFILCLSPEVGFNDDEETCRRKGLESLQSSALVRQLGKIPDTKKEGEIRELKQSPQGDQEMYLDLRTGQIDRTILVLIRKTQNRLFVLAGGTRRSRFPAQESTLRTALQSFKKVE